MNEQEKLHVLAQIAQRFNAAQLTWALGASCFLYLQGVAPTFHDLDLMIAEKDEGPALAILTNLGKRQSDRYDRVHYGTHLFAEFVIQGVDVDLMAGFSVILEGQEIPFPLKESSLVGQGLVEGQRVPFESLEIWRERYQAMGRKEKVAMIEAYLARK